VIGAACADFVSGRSTLSKNAMPLTMTPHGSSCKRIAMKATSGSSSTVTGDPGALPASV
jgi:hypothetical protein